MPSVRSLTAIFLLIGGAHVEASPIATCPAQNACLDWQITKTTPGTCTSPTGCVWTVCVTLNEGPGCPKQGSISHTCKKDPNVCQAENSGFHGIQPVSIGNGATQCQTGVGGTTLHFVFKDGHGCGSTATKAIGSGLSSTSASCTGTTHKFQTCTGNPAGFECWWSVPLPDCTCPTGQHHSANGCIADCVCDHGQVDDQATCAIGGAQHCKTCLGGYTSVLMANGLKQCQINTCQCAHGDPLTGTSCPDQALEACNTCAKPPNGPAFVKTLIPNTNPPRYTCMEPAALPTKICTCPHGQKKGGADCKNDNDVDCYGCDAGFTLTAEGTRQVCKQPAPANKCTCKHGTPVTGAACTTDGDEICEANSCKDGTTFNAATKECEAPHHCDDGLVAGWTAAKQEWCCKFEGKGCTKACVCNNGFGKMGAECHTNGAEDCNKCNAGFALVVTDQTLKTQKCFKLCTCPNGNPLMGDRCPSPGAIACSDCKNGFDLTAGGHCEAKPAAQPKVCKCPGGTTVPDGSAKCQKAGDIACEHCGPGYTLVGTECKPDNQATIGNCKCTDGTVVGACNFQGANTEACDSCNKGFNLVQFLVEAEQKQSKKCVPDVAFGTKPHKVCTCSGGIAARDHLCDIAADQKEACSGCNAGHKFQPDVVDGKVGKCPLTPPAGNQKVCKCTGGKAVDSAECALQGQEACSRCTDGFVLVPHAPNAKFGKCQEIPKVCRCPGGMPLTGSECPHRGQQGCKHCSAGFQLFGLECKQMKPVVKPPVVKPPGQLESMTPGALHAKNKAANALGRFSIPERVQIGSSSNGFLIGLVAGSVSAIGLFVGARMWQRSRQHGSDTAMLLSEEFEEVEGKHSVA